MSLSTAQEDIPICFAPGECTNSLQLESWEVETLSDCLVKCNETRDCEFFNYYIPIGGKNNCVSLANCANYSPGSCADCNVGKRSCHGEDHF